MLWLVFAVAAACGSSATGAPTDDPVRGQRAQPMTPPPVAPSPTPEPAPPDPAPSDEPAAVNVTAGNCDVAWLPAGMVVDLSDDEAASVIDAVREWVGPGGVRTLVIDSQRGIAWAKSEDDLGSDPPYATHTRAQGGLACGVASRWLADHIQVAFSRSASPDYAGVICQENVCCYAGMEYMSRGILVVRLNPNPDAPRFLIDAHAEIAEATLGDQVIAANRAHVTRTLTRHRRATCPNEPAGAQ